MILWIPFMVVMAVVSAPALMLFVCVVATVDMAVHGHDTLLFR